MEIIIWIEEVGNFYGAQQCPTCMVEKIFPMEINHAGGRYHVEIVSRTWKSAPAGKPLFGFRQKSDWPAGLQFKAWQAAWSLVKIETPVTPASMATMAESTTEKKCKTRTARQTRNTQQGQQASFLV